MRMGSKESTINLKALLRGYALPIICIVLSLVLLFVLTLPTFNRMKELGTEQETTQERLSSLSEKIDILEDFSQTKPRTQLESYFDDFDQAIPSENDVPALLTQVELIAQKSGVAVVALQYGGELASEEEAATSAEVRVTFSPKGSFSSLLRLLQEFEKASRVIDVETVKYSAQEGAGYSMLQAELVLVSYYTSTPILKANTPITLDFDNTNFEENVQTLSKLTLYEE
jgi:Tfp pilus assembly protein PilO